MKLTNKEAIANLNHIYGIVSPDIQRSLDVAIKALEEKAEWDKLKLICANEGVVVYKVRGEEE